MIAILLKSFYIYRISLFVCFFSPKIHLVVLERECFHLGIATVRLRRTVEENTGFIFGIWDASYLPQLRVVKPEMFVDRELYKRKTADSSDMQEEGLESHIVSVLLLLYICFHHTSHLEVRVESDL